ncbi:MAG: SDR family oxidoreductase [Planctomycetaceae bacterium]|nr:SDR family oxidoreductase [Planctomycetaceae bacterium]
MSPPQVMLLTGCASGIGRQLTTSLAAAGHLLVATDVNLAGLERAAQQHGWPVERVACRELDVRDPAGWGAALDLALERWARIDVVFNIAGYLQPGLVHAQSPADVDRHLDINAKGTIYGTQAAAARMVRQGSGQIVNIASLAGVAPVPGISLYTASKFAVRGFSLAMANELRPYGVAVSVVCPDAVRTPMLELQLDYPEAALTFSGNRPLEVSDVERLILQHVLQRKPLEAILPRHRGWLAKLTNVLPGLSRRLLPLLVKKGLAGQAAARARRTVSADDSPVAPRP